MFLWLILGIEYCEYFPAVMLCKLGEGKRSSLLAESSELVLVYGLEQCDRLSA